MVGQPRPTCNLCCSCGCKVVCEAHTQPVLLRSTWQGERRELPTAAAAHLPGLYVMHLVALLRALGRTHTSQAPSSRT